MTRFLLRTVFTAIALWLVALWLPGIEVDSFGPEWWQVGLTYLLVALVFGLVNGIIGNLIRIVAFPIYLLTLGLVSFLVNGFLLVIVHWISEAVGFGLRVEGFWWGVLGAFLIGIITWLITMLTKPILGSEKPREK